jgi:hypothetical protein
MRAISSEVRSEDSQTHTSGASDTTLITARVV